MENEIKKLIAKWDSQRYMYNQAWQNACEEIIKDLKSFLAKDSSLIIAFVQGARWWEYHSTKFTMWQSDQRLAEEEAARKLEKGTLGNNFLE